MSPSCPHSLASLKNLRCNTSQQNAQLWNSQSPECRTTFPNREIPATSVGPSVPNTPGKIREASPAGYPHAKATKRSSKGQMKRIHLRPCLVPSSCWARKKYQRLLLTVRHLETSGVSRVWQAWHVPWAPLWRGRKNCLTKIKIFIYSLLKLYCILRPIKLHQHSAPASNVGHVTPAPPRIMTKLSYCDITQRSDIVKEQARSFAVSLQDLVLFTL